MGVRSSFQRRSRSGVKSRLMWRLTIWCFKIWCSAICGLLIAAGGAQAQTVETMKAPSFGTVTIYSPAKAEGPPKSVVLFISGDGGWNRGVVAMAQQLRDAGALVAGIDIRPFVKSLNTTSGCAYPAGALEELSRAVQLRMKVPKYQRPILVGYSSGATLVYAAIAAAPPETFAGAISLGFCPDIEIKQPPCHQGGLTSTKTPRRVGYDLAPYRASTVPWMVLQGDIDQVCDPNGTKAFVSATGASRLFWLPRVGHGFGVPSRWAPQFLEAYRAVVDARHARDVPRSKTPIAAAVADLGLIEVPATASATSPASAAPASVRDDLAIVMTGDGGWASLDKQIAASLAEAGVPVVGWSSLEYYWTARTPDEAAVDLARIINHYTAAWHKTRVRIIGYSFGADVASFLVNRLPDAVRRQVASVVLLAPSPTATFEFHLTDWIRGREDARYPTAREIAQMRPPVTCVVPRDEPDSVCHEIKSASLRTVTFGSGHHFGDDSKGLADLVLR
jgi:type IV secretory pathway VirJ component